MASVPTALYGFLPPELLQIFTDAWTELDGDAELAMAKVRQASAYDTYYAGNRRADGTVRMPEFEYASYNDFYRRTLASVNLNPDLFSDRFVELVEGDVSPSEFVERVNTLYNRVVTSAPGIREYYAANFGLELTDSAIMASVLDPDLGTKVLTRQVDIAEIGGEAALRGFGLSTDFAERILTQGYDRQGASEFFSQASMAVPILNVLARRHYDPDDDFDINEFTMASIFDDPIQRDRMRRLLEQERSLYSVGGVYRTADTGAVTGLLDR